METQAIPLPSSLLQPRQQGEDETLASILGRLQEERGAFRHITEQGLQSEIATQEQEEESSDTDEDEDTAEVDGPDSKDRREQLYTARAEMLTHIGHAHESALMTLDFVSLLLSKDAPKQAELTMSPHLKQLTKPGTLGIDFWQNVQPDPYQQKVDSTIAQSWRMQSLQDSADSLLGAAARLEKNVRRETKYWEQVLSVSDKGWSISRLPGEKHNLGVRFGFLEALGEFRSRGLAALRSDEVGNVLLDKGVGNNSKLLRVRVKKGDNIVGTSDMPNTSDDSQTPLEARIRHARDSLYEEELFHEIIRESRDLASYGIDMRESTIRLPTRLTPSNTSTSAANDYQVLIDLVPLSNVGQQVKEPQPQDTWAQAIALALRLLLSYTHRERLAIRSEIPPPISITKPEAPVASIMRPILTLLQHRSIMTDVDAYLERVKKLFTASSIDVAIESTAFDPEFIRSAESIGVLMSKALTPLQSRGKVSVRTPGRDDAIEFGIEIHTSISAPVFGSVMSITSSLGSPRVDVTEMDDLREYVDAGLASALGQGIVSQSTYWTYNERTGLLSTTDLEVKMLLEVKLRSEDATQDVLALRTAEDDFEWKVDDMKHGGFWKVVKQEVWDMDVK